MMTLFKNNSDIHLIYERENCFIYDNCVHKKRNKSKKKKVKSRKILIAKAVWKNFKLNDNWPIKIDHRMRT